VRRSRDGESSAPQRPVCPGCGEPLGIYKALWRIAPDVGAERTSWLRLGTRDATLESLGHANCGEGFGVDGR
jgi:hypothetical protein